MNKERAILKDSPFYCVHISSEDLGAIKRFQSANKRSGFLVRYLQEVALIDEDAGNARTYLVYDEDTAELVAYFSLKAGFVATNESKSPFTRAFDTEPGVEISNFAVNGEYKKAHPDARHVGAYIFEAFILPLIKAAAEKIGIRILYIFALPYTPLIDYYRSLHFIRLSTDQERAMHRRIKPRYDRGCIFMYQVL